MTVVFELSGALPKAANLLFSESWTSVSSDANALVVDEHDVKVEVAPDRVPVFHLKVDVKIQNHMFRRSQMDSRIANGSGSGSQTVGAG